MHTRWFDLELDENARVLTGAPRGPPVDPEFVWVERLDADCCSCCGCFQSSGRSSKARGRRRWRLCGEGCKGCAWLGLVLALLGMLVLILVATSLDGLGSSEAGSGGF
jgi:hypothetical protein